MKNRTTFLLFILLIWSCATQPKSQLQTLQGTWIPVRQEFQGNDVPPSYYANQSLTIKDSTYVVKAEDTDKGIIRVNGNTLDIIGKEGPNTDLHFKALYKMENEHLIIIYELSGSGYPSDFITKDFPTRYLIEFKRKE